MTIGREQGHTSGGRAADDRMRKIAGGGDGSAGVLDRRWKLAIDRDRCGTGAGRRVDRCLFPENRHDFGMVPRGVKVKHDFLLVNRLAEPITILNLRPSCGCTSGRTNTSMVAPGQTAVIEAEMDTRNFVGPKSTVLYVSLITASGREGEVGLGVTSHILSDVVLNPGAITLGPSCAASRRPRS